MCHSGLPGAIAPVGEFDPAGFSRDVDELEMNRLRECEPVSYTHLTLPTILLV